MRRRVGVVLTVLLAGAAIAVIATAVSPRGGMREGIAGGSGPAPSEEVASIDADASPIFVHVLGHVARPGLYELRADDRVIDAVAAAGGLIESADPAGVNLARILSDGEQLLVPGLGEVVAAAPPGVTADGRVDLNTADAATLESLPRIGPAMAQRIIDHRASHGPFASADDLLSVSGIGAKTLEALRPLVSP